MKSNLILLSASLLVIAGTHGAQAAPAVTNAGASMETVLCPVRAGDSVVVYDANARPVGIKVAPHEPVRRFQGWGENVKNATINGSHLRLVRVQLPRHASTQNSPVYVYEGHVASKATCQQRAPQLPYHNVFTDNKAMAAAKELYGEEEDEGVHEGDDGADDHPTILGTANASLNNITKGLNTPSCCLFPMETRPTSFLSGMGQFGARRGRRTHAGADLYGRTGQKIRAVEAGQVIRAPYYFKKNTIAIDVRHAGGFVARYAEMVDRNAGMSLGTTLTRGQQVGTMAKLPCCEPMLHFEIYTGTGRGKLSVEGNRYSRRSDLVDPTNYLKRWKMQ